MKRLTLLLTLALFSLLFGCLGPLGAFGCQFAPEDDKDHCYQFAAREATDPSLCEKIKGTGFTYSNPPKDKCYLQVANKTNNADLCSNIEGGPMSYTPSECITNVAKNTKDPTVCQDLTGEARRSCIIAAGGNPDVIQKEQDTDVHTNTTESTESESTDGKKEEKSQQNPTEQTEQSTSQSKQGKTGQDLSTEPKTTDGGSEENDGSGPDKNTDAKNVIPKAEAEATIEKEPEYTKMGLEPADPSKISKRTKAGIGSMGDHAADALSKASSESFDKLASQKKIPIPPSEPQKEPGYLERAWDWMGWGAQKGSDALGDSAPDSMKNAAKGKEITDYGKDVLDAKGSFDKVNNDIKKGKYTKSRGKLLKVGYGLGKGVKWIASKVPIVGDTAGTIADESFKATMGFGKKLANRATKQDKCIDDPLADECID